MPPQSSPDRLKSLWLRFLAVHAAFACAFGFFGSYSLLYLSTQLRAAGARNNILDELLPVLAGTMLLDAVLGPVAGNFADGNGRRKASLASVVFLGLALLASAAIAGLLDVPARWALDLGIGAQILLAVSAAFYATSLDAWWVDLLQDKRFPTGSELQRYFSRQAQVSGFFLVLGGAASIFLGPSLSGGPGAKAGLGFSDPGCWIFIAGAAACVLLGLAIRYGLDLPQPTPRAALSTAEEVRWKAAMLWRSPEIPRVLAVTSIIYLCSTAFLYLVPLLLNDASVIQSGASAHHWVGEHYWAFYLLMGSSRLLGPILSQAIRFDSSRSFGPSRKREFALWSSLVCWSLFFAAGAYLLLPREALDLALPLLVGARILAEAFKPVQAAHVNELVSQRSMRAFALSLTTAPGSVAAAIGAAVLMSQFNSLERALELWARPARSIPIVLMVMAVVSWLLLKILLRERGARVAQAEAPNLMPPLISPEAVASLQRALADRALARIKPEIRPARRRSKRLPSRPSILRARSTGRRSEKTLEPRT